MKNIKLKKISAAVVISFASAGFLTTANAPGAFALPDSQDNVNSSNIVDTGGHVDVTGISATVNDNDTVTYKYQVSVLPMMSSSHTQTSSVFKMSVPKFVEQDQVKFTLVGTYDSSVHLNNVDGISVPATEIIRVNRPLDVFSDRNLFYKYDDNTGFTNVSHQIPTTEQIQRELDSGLTSTPNAVFYAPAGTTYEYFSVDSTEPTDSMNRYYIKSSFVKPVVMEVEITVPLDVAQTYKTVPLRVENFTRAFEAGSAETAEGAQRFDIAPYRFWDDSIKQLVEDFPDQYANLPYVDDWMSPLTHPELIDADSVLPAGLMGVSTCTPTEPSAFGAIGYDIAASVFSYVDTFQLESHPYASFLTTKNEDMCDQDAIMSTQLFTPESANDSSTTPQGQSVNIDVLNNDTPSDVDFDLHLMECHY